MKYYVDENANEFEFWSGALSNIEEARGLGTVDQVFEILEEMFAEGDASRTEINDYVWFYMPRDYPELFKEDEDEDERW